MRGPSFALRKPGGRHFGCGPVAAAIALQTMENYQKSKVVEKPSPLPFTSLPSDIIEMKVKDGSKIQNLMGYAIGKMEQETTRQMLFSRVGKAINKTITCVEIMKRRLKDLHQITKVFFQQIEEDLLSFILCQSSFFLVLVATKART
ncbi:ribonuclease P protein subunit p25-like protein [Vipera latastei]